MSEESKVITPTPDERAHIGYKQRNPCGGVAQQRGFTVIQKAAPQKHECTREDVEDAANIYAKEPTEDDPHPQVCLTLGAVVECEDCERRYFYRNDDNGFWKTPRWFRETDRQYRKRMKKQRKAASNA